MSVTRNPVTGATHTAKWPSILAGIVGGTLLILGALEKHTGFSWLTAREVGIPLLVFAGIGLAAMARRR